MHFSEEQYAQAINRLARNEGHRKRLPQTANATFGAKNKPAYELMQSIITQGEVSAQQLCDATGWNRNTVNSRLRQMKYWDMVENINGKWSMK